MSKSKIEWTEQTANPIIGCSKCSPACKNCYALTRARRLAGMKGPVGDDYRRVVTDGEWNGKTVFIPGVLDKIVRRKKPTTYFIGSMTDIFHESVPDDWIDQIMATIAMCPQHRFMLLTKRPIRMRKYYCKEPLRSRLLDTLNDMDDYEYDPRESAAFLIANEKTWPLPNLALGVSVWDQASADRAIPLLLQTPAARRFVSAEPLLGSVDSHRSEMCLDCQPFGRDKCHEHQKIDLVIVGGETGPGARPMHPDWARSLRDQCASAGVPFMFKQWGRWGWKYDDLMEAEYMVDFWTSKSAGRLLDGVEHNGAIQWEEAR